MPQAISVTLEYLWLNRDVGEVAVAVSLIIALKSLPLDCG